MSLKDAGYCFLIIVVYAGLFKLAHEFEQQRTAERHLRYVACVESGERPLICSFNSVFKETK